MPRGLMVAAATAAVLALASCTTPADGGAQSASASSVPSEAGTATASPRAGGPSGSVAASASTQSPDEARQIHIVSGGDILLHQSVNEAAKRASGGKLDYAPLMAPIQPWIEGADLSLCALEAPVAPPGEEPSDYPSFGTPPEIATSLKKAGWDGCATATNHSMDRGIEGTKATLDALDRSGLGHHGTARTADESERTQFYTLRTGKRKVKVAHLSATTLTNGLKAQAGAEWSWNVVGSQGHRSVDDLIHDASKARKDGADLVVLSMHWGTEYVSQPVAEQRRIADKLAKSGKIDLVFGNHSHVPEPVTELSGGPDGNGMWVAWSMGNLISGQATAEKDERVTSGLLTTATVDVPAKGPVSVSALDWTALTEDMKTHHVYPLRSLEKGYRDKGMTLSKADIARRGRGTYGVMKGGAERVDPPSAASTLER